MKKQFSHIFSLFLALTVFCTLLTGCGVANAADSNPVNLTVGTMYSLACAYDPTLSSVTKPVMPYIYDRLFLMDSETGEIRGNVAESWEYTDDLTLQVTLRDDVYFSNGDKLEADDVLFSLERYLVNTTHLTTSNIVNINFDNCVADGINLTIAFFETDPVFISRVANSYIFSILDKDYVEKVGEEEATLYSPIGSGPYVVVDSVPDSYITLVRNDAYWGDAPGAETITYKYYAEETTMMIDFENGDIDVALNINDANRARIEAGEAAGTAKVISKSEYLDFSLASYVEAFKDPAVREAFAHAINYEAIVEAAYGSLGRPMTSTLFDSMAYYEDLSDDGIGPYSYDPDLSRQLLADAGYSDGDITIRTVIVNSPTNIKVAEALQANLADVGINLEIEAYDVATAIGYFVSGDLDVSLAEMSSVCFDPALVYSSSRSNSTNLAVRREEEDINEYLTIGATSMDEAARGEAYKNAQEWFKETCWLIPVCEQYACVAYNDKIDYLPVREYLSPDFANASYNG